MKKILPALVSLLLILVFSPAALCAETGKDETIYVNLGSDGSIDEVFVVNHIETPKAGTYTDYGTYDEIVNLTGEEEPAVEGDKITWELPAYENGFYYKGTMDKALLPWNLQFTYQWNGKTVSASELAGVRGEITIHIKASRNLVTASYFSENFAMQLSQELNTDICKNIEAPDGAKIIAGQTATISYTVLPGDSLDTTIRFTANDFSADGMTIVFTPFSLSSLSSFSDLSANIDEIIDAMSALIEGTESIYDGANSVADGLNGLSTGAATLSTASSDASTGLDAYETGLDAFSTAMTSYFTEISTTLAELSALSEQLSATQETLSGYQSELNETLTGLDATLSGYQQTIDQAETALTTLSTTLSGLQSGLNNLIEANDQMEYQLNTIIGGYQTLCANYETYTASLAALADSDTTLLAQSLLSSDDDDVRTLAQAYIDQQSTIAQLYTAFSTLNGSFNNANDDFSAGITTIATGYDDIGGGLTAMSNAVTQLQQGMNGAFDFFSLTTALSGLQAQLTAVEDTMDQLSVNLPVIDTETYEEGITSANDGLNALTGGFDLLNSSLQEDYFPAVTSLSDHLTLLDESYLPLPEGLHSLNEGETALRDGILEAGNALTPGDTGETVSFTSPQNDPPNSTQFILSTPEIRVETKAETTDSGDEATETTLWQRLTNIF